ncbi:CDP-diacylglycerol--glycerol-3-phosphate 3-phosphatidyltransferase [Mobilicoccus massiliensis]|uniref:CDP-diacylglycerol--glycerol-3-phosphate 3-phosphatidyltransferase n=1 Tax=Mobilicoccus massiliensis TaxID=1522310 RepID=UPI0005912EFD|nr:CDP-diacylglycerol--glycerol-3-phosphate 3-phosphatidyltransferase [Mobilicoccus massiliensis]
MSTASTPGSGDDGMARPSNVNVPNALTLLRIVLVPVFLWLLLRHGGLDVSDRWWAFGVFTVAMITDRIDGDLARKYGLVTDFGKIADPIADKALTGAAFIGLSLIGELWWWVTIVVLVRELGITLLRFVVIRYGVMPASKGGKLKTALQALALGLFIAPLGGVFVWAASAVMGAAVVVTVVTGIDYVLAARRLVAESTADEGRA